MINFSTRKVGGIRFVKLGRFCFSFCITRSYVPMGDKPARVHRSDNSFRMLDDIEGELAVITAAIRRD